MGVVKEVGRAVDDLSVGDKVKNMLGQKYVFFEMCFFAFSIIVSLSVFLRIIVA